MVIPLGLEMAAKFPVSMLFVNCCAAATFASV